MEKGGSGMTSKELKELFEKEFDAVGIIPTGKYLEEAEKMGKITPQITYPTLVVVGLSYSPRHFAHTKTHLVPSFYTFGQDYHYVLKTKINKIVKEIPYASVIGVDNHPHHERLAASLAGIGYFGKNQLIIHPLYGTYIFLGMVFIDMKLTHEWVPMVNDSCGTCRKCIESCPVHALSEEGFILEKCMSHYNQQKKVLTEEEIKANYSLFGCDICQMVCPKNINKVSKMHPEFALSGKEKVAITDLFQDSEKEFNKKYEGMAFLWKGKTILMRNALTLLLRNKNTFYNPLIKESLKHQVPVWYRTTAEHILKKLDELENG